VNAVGVIECANCDYWMTEAEAYAAPMWRDPEWITFLFWCPACAHLAEEQAPRRWVPTVITGDGSGEPTLPFRSLQAVEPPKPRKSTHSPRSSTERSNS
jgi:hypothetical protein